GPIVAATAADHNLVTGHTKGFSSAIIFILDYGQLSSIVFGRGCGSGGGFVLRRGGGFDSGESAGGDALGHGAGAELGLGGHGELGIDDDVAGRDVVVGVLQNADLPAAFGDGDFGLGAAGEFQAFAEGGLVETLDFLV